VPLLDHFHPPLSDRRHWHSFHNSWATYLSSQINALLPEGYFAEANVQFGVEIDVATFGDADFVSSSLDWAPSPANSSMPLALAGAVVEIGIFGRVGGPSLAAAIELVSPSNKDRPSHRDALISKCASYLQMGVGLALIDVVTDRSADLHRDLLVRLGGAGQATGESLFAAAYRPVERDGAATLDIWHDSIAIGGRLPTLPLWLRGGLCIPVNLEAAYARTCLEQRITPAA